MHGSSWEGEIKYIMEMDWGLLEEECRERRLELGGNMRTV